METLLKNPAKVRYLTGLPSMAILMAVYNLVSPGMPDCQALLTKFDQLLLMLMNSM